MKGKKYILTDITMEYVGHKLYRIKAVKDFGDVHEGDLGGWVETEDNLSQFGNCWIYDNAKVCENANVHGEAIICGGAKIESDEDYAVFKNTWSSGRYFTWTRSNNKWKVGCFYGSGEELIAKAYADNEKKGKCYEAIVKAQELISNIK